MAQLARLEAQRMSVGEPYKDPATTSMKYSPATISNLGEDMSLSGPRTVAETAVRAKFAEALDEPGKQYMTWVEANRNKSAVHPNSKTGLSLDFTTSCCNRTGSKGACAYCYVEQPRTGLEKLGLNKYITSRKTVVETPYPLEPGKGPIAQMPDSVVTELNSDGGMRHQSFSDWMPNHKPMFEAALRDAKAKVSPANPKGLIIKTITKEPEFVKMYGNDPNVRINISVDDLPRSWSNSPTVEQAFALKEGRSNVAVRSVALNEAQLEKQLADPRVEVVTAYHGPVGEELFQIVKAQNPELIARHGEKAVRAELSTWQNMREKGADMIYKNAARTKNGAAKLCCQSGKCSKDTTKCGFSTSGLGMLIPGVMIPDGSEE
jgi:hypothetical protein